MTIQVGDAPGKIIPAGNNLWVLTNQDRDGMLVQVDAATGSVLQNVETGRNTISLIFDGTDLWVTVDAGQAQLIRVDGTSGKKASIPIDPQPQQPVRAAREPLAHDWAFGQPEQIASPNAER